MREQACCYPCFMILVGMCTYQPGLFGNNEGFFSVSV